MHTIGKHGPEIHDAAMKQRAIDGTDPTTGRSGRVNSSSQFRTWKMQLHAINEALTREARGMSPHTGFDRKENPIVRIEQPNTGRGYKPNKKDTQNPKLNESMNGAEVKFDPKNSDRPFTAFPIK